MKTSALVLCLCLGAASAFVPLHTGRNSMALRRFAEDKPTPAPKAESAGKAEEPAAKAEKPSAKADKPAAKAEKPAAKEAEPAEEVVEAPPPPPKMSTALPFMECPENLDGTMAGDVGFDPLGFSDTFDIKWLREAEIKHGRLCQLAVVGFAATDLGLRLPGDMHQVSSVAAHDVALKYGAMNQLFLWIGLFEAFSAVGIFQMMYEDSGRVPGDFKLDPLNYCSTPEKEADMKLKEITHCRLAMFAFSGMVTQAVLTQGPYPYL